MKETWRPIPGYEGYYECSDLGNVRSIDRLIGNRLFKGKILKRLLGSHGYYTVVLSKDGKVKTRTIHSLVMLTFIGPPPEGLEVLHGEGGPADNSLSNLKYGTRSENMHDMRRDGTNFYLNKSRCPRGHLLKCPNLVPSALKKGKRNCLACMNGLAYIKYRKSKGEVFTDRDVIVVTDRYYLQIMGENYEL